MQLSVSADCLKARRERQVWCLPPAEEGRRGCREGAQKRTQLTEVGQFV